MKYLKNFDTMYRTLNEQFQLLSIPLAEINILPGNNDKMIKLKAFDKNSKKNLVLDYEVSAKYGLIGFDVSLRNIRRGKGGNLLAEAMPDSWAGRKALSKLVSDEFKTGDGWLLVDIPKEKIEGAVSQLKTNKGSKAVLDAGNGVKVILKSSSTKGGPVV